jgi:hypothetical protein
MQHSSLQVTHFCYNFAAIGRLRIAHAAAGESDAIRQELNAHNAAQRARYRARAASQQGRLHLIAVGVA